MKIQCSKGFGRPVNPHKIEDYLNLQLYRDKANDFDRANPSLPTYTANGDKFMGEGVFEGRKGLICRKPGNSNWNIIPDDTDDDYMCVSDLDYSGCYIIHPQPEEKPEGAEIKPFPMEEFEKIKSRFNSDEYDIHDVIIRAFHLGETQSTRERGQDYTESEVREIAKAFDTWDGLNFDKWWQVTKLNKANLK